MVVRPQYPLQSQHPDTLPCRKILSNGLILSAKFAHEIVVALNALKWPSGRQAFGNRSESEPIPLLSEMQTPEEMKAFLEEVDQHFLAPTLPKPIAENSGIKLTTEALDAWVNNARVLTDEERAEHMSRLRTSCG
jgi:hypothetical protein